MTAPLVRHGVGQLDGSHASAVDTERAAALLTEHGSGQSIGSHADDADAAADVWVAAHGNGHDAASTHTGSHASDSATATVAEAVAAHGIGHGLQLSRSATEHDDTEALVAFRAERGPACATDAADTSIRVANIHNEMERFMKRLLFAWGIARR